MKTYVETVTLAQEEFPNPSIESKEAVDFCVNQLRGLITHKLNLENNIIVIEAWRIDFDDRTYQWKLTVVINDYTEDVEERLRIGV
jgi:hypothetical protein